MRRVSEKQVNIYMAIVCLIEKLVAAIEKGESLLAYSSLRVIEAIIDRVRQLGVSEVLTSGDVTFELWDAPHRMS